MLVPKAAMDEDDLSAWAKHKIGFAREVLPVEPVTIAKPMYGRSHQEFGLGVLRPDRLHVAAARLSSDVGFLHAARHKRHL